MKDLELDRLGRPTFHRIEARKLVRTTKREVRWLKHIERHGPQSSEFLFELTRGTHRCKDTSLRDLQKLRAGGFLRLPRQQLATERAEFNPYIYDLTAHSTDFLKSLGLSELTVRPTGHWWHAYTIAAFTGTLDVLCQRKGREFIPAHTILARAGVDMAVPVGNRHIIPDQLFAVWYEDGFRAFMLEVDRGTEPFLSGLRRKSLAHAIDLYAAMLKSDTHRRHYGLTANTLVLWVFTDPSRLANFRDLLSERAGRFAGHFLLKSLPMRLSWDGSEEMHGQFWVDGFGEVVRGL